MLNPPSMAAKAKKFVRLVVPSKGLSESFEIGHAERILRMGAYNGGWQLPEDSKYSFSIENGLRLKPSTRAAAESKE